MSIPLSQHTQRLIEEGVRRGGYASADDLILAGLDALQQQQSMEDFEPGEMNALLSEGENSGPSLDGEQVLSELSTLREHRPSKAG